MLVSTMGTEVRPLSPFERSRGAYVEHYAISLVRVKWGPENPGMVLQIATEPSGDKDLVLLHLMR